MTKSAAMSTPRAATRFLCWHFPVLMVLLFSGSLFAQLSPGELSRAHAKLEGMSNCTQCHSAGKGISTASCLGCHIELKKRVDAGTSLHARAEYKECFLCHSEHHGREFRIVFWKGGMDVFDHTLTGYALEGGHGDLDCRKCHNADKIVFANALSEAGKDLNRTFLGLQRLCVNCHLDVHYGDLGNDCQKCHDQKAFKPPTKFDHDKTKFKLTGEHRKVECNACHPSVKSREGKDRVSFKVASFKQCSSCHKDAHQGRFGPDCSSCHNTGGWRSLKRTAKFDHDKTRYPLRGKHIGLECESCHKRGVAKRGIKFAKCLDCHQDPHRGQFASRKARGECAECHTVERFAPSTFTTEQHLLSDFPLEGAHLAVPCFACHVEKEPRVLRSGAKLQMNRFTIAYSQCTDCHRDPHGGETKSFMTAAAGCKSCHSSESWQNVTAFDHSKTGFVLEDKHAETNCTSCHEAKKSGNQISMRFAGNKQECQSCHEDLHAGQFAGNTIKDGVAVKVTDCASCHTAANWQASRFDHGRDSTFKLDGAHEKVECILCHKPFAHQGKDVIRYKPLESECISCHGR